MQSINKQQRRYSLEKSFENKSVMVRNGLWNGSVIRSDVRSYLKLGLVVIQV